MTAHDFDRLDSRNDPDLQDPPRCRHRDGDPDCMCHDAEDEARDALDDANAVVWLDETLRDIQDVICPPDEDQISSPEKRARLDGVEAKIQAIFASMRSDFA